VIGRFVKIEPLKGDSTKMRAIKMTAFLALVTLLGCGSEELESPADVDDDAGLAPPAEGQGIQLKMVFDLPAGEETESCMLIQVGPDGLAFNHTQIEYTSGSHHILLFETPYTTMPTEDKHGVKLDPTQIHGCPSGGGDHWDITRVIGGSQNADGANAVDELPEGVGFKLAPGSILLLNTHYLNASSERLKTDARINLYTVPFDSVKEEAGALFYYNPFINIRAHSTNSATMSCPIAKDIKLLNMQSHMHRRGVGYVANLTDGKGEKLQELYTNDLWEGVPIKRYGAGLDIKAGQRLDYRCDYNNAEDRDIIQGLTTEDEMCVLLGVYYPRDTHLERCEDENGDRNGTWIGSGKALCGDSFKCILDALRGPEDEAEAAYFGCVVDACPGVAPELSGLVACQISVGYGACDDACEKLTAPSCMDCLLSECAAEVTACGAAKCE
jgi:Copper type II ascorbate-dependent monooxygenase, C-terminal domain